VPILATKWRALVDGSEVFVGGEVDDGAVAVARKVPKECLHTYIIL
jgi:hypothetical protein